MCKATRLIRGLAAATLALAMPADAANAPWPARAVHIIVVQASGGPPDLIARFIAEPPGRSLGVPVVVDKRPGAAGIIGVGAPWSGPSDLPPGPGLRLALFPQEWYRDVDSAWLRALPTDAPWQDPQLLSAMFNVQVDAAIADRGA